MLYRVRGPPAREAANARAASGSEPLRSNAPASPRGGADEVGAPSRATAAGGSVRGVGGADAVARAGGVAAGVGRTGARVGDGAAAAVAVEVGAGVGRGGNVVGTGAPAVRGGATAAARLPAGRPRK